MVRYMRTVVVAGLAVLASVGGAAAQTGQQLREFQVPRGDWQVPKPIQQPKGPWLTPKDFQKPGSVQPVVEDCRRRLLVGSDTLFAFDKAELGPEAAVSLDAVAKLIGETKGQVTIEGHTDSKGHDDYNQKLSERRAAAVRDWLAANGVVPRGARVVGHGERRPVAPNEKADGSDDPDGRALNRRVEVVIATCG